MAFLTGSLVDGGDFLVGSLVFTADVLAPSFTSGLGLVSADTSSVTVSYSVSEAAAVFFLVVPRNSQVPTPPQIIDGVDYGAVTVAGAGNESVNGGDSEQFQVTGLDADVEYTIYAVARDASLNVGDQTFVRNINFTTDTVFVSSPPVMSGDEVVLVSEGSTSVGAFPATSGSGTITYSKSGVDSNKFILNVNTGQLEFVSAPNISTPDDDNADGDYLVTITASNTDGSDSQNLTIRLVSSDRPSTEFIVKSEERLITTNSLNIDYYPELHPPIKQKVGDTWLYEFDFTEILGSNTTIDAKQVTLTGATNRGEYIQGGKIGVYVEGLYANVVACLNVQAISNVLPSISLTSTIYIRFK